MTNHLNLLLKKLKQMLLILGVPEHQLINLLPHLTLGQMLEMNNSLQQWQVDGEGVPQIKIQEQHQLKIIVNLRLVGVMLGLVKEL